MRSLLPKTSKGQRRFLFVAAAILVIGVIYLRYKHTTEGFQTANLTFLESKLKVFEKALEDRKSGKTTTGSSVEVLETNIATIKKQIEDEKKKQPPKPLTLTDLKTTYGPLKVDDQKKIINIVNAITPISNLTDKKVVGAALDAFYKKNSNRANTLRPYLGNGPSIDITKEENKDVRINIGTAGLTEIDKLNELKQKTDKSTITSFDITKYPILHQVLRGANEYDKFSKPNLAKISKDYEKNNYANGLKRHIDRTIKNRFLDPSVTSMIYYYDTMDVLAKELNK